MENDSASPKRNYLKTFIQLIIFLGLGIFFVWLSVKGMTSEDVAMLKQSASVVNNPMSWFWLVMSVLTGALAHYWRSRRSILLLEPLNYKVRKSMSFYSVMVCYICNLALPRLGELLRCTFLQRYEKVPFQKSLGTVVTERAIDMICWIVMFVIAIFLNTSVLSQLVIDKNTGATLATWMEQKGMSMIGNYILYILAAVIILFVLIVFLTKKWWMKVPFFVKIKDIVVGVWQGLISIKDLKHPWLFVLYTALIWIFYLAGTYCCFFAFDFLQNLGITAAYSVLIFGSIGFMVAQGGLGAYPLIVAGVLVLYGIDYNAGLAAGWIGWTAQTVMVIVFGLASLILASFYKQKSSVQ